MKNIFYLITNTFIISFLLLINTVQAQDLFVFKQDATGNLIYVPPSTTIDTGYMNDTGKFTVLSLTGSWNLLPLSSGMSFAPTTGTAGAATQVTWTMNPPMPAADQPISIFITNSSNATYNFTYKTGSSPSSNTINCNSGALNVSGNIGSPVSANHSISVNLTSGSINLTAGQQIGSANGLYVSVANNLNVSAPYSGNIAVTISGTPTSAAINIPITIPVTGGGTPNCTLTGTLTAPTFTLYCNTTVVNGNMIQGQNSSVSGYLNFTASGSLSIPAYTSSTINGLTLHSNAVSYPGTSIIPFTISGTPVNKGTFQIPVTILGQTCNVTIIVKGDGGIEIYPTDMPKGYSWYEYANVRDNYDSFNIPPLPPSTQVSPARQGSCAALPTDNPANPWRLPTLEEVEAISKQLAAGPYWTATTSVPGGGNSMVPNDKRKAMVANFSYSAPGYRFNTFKSVKTNFNVRCVRTNY